MSADFNITSHHGLISVQCKIHLMFAKIETDISCQTGHNNTNQSTKELKLARVKHGQQTAKHWG